VVKLQDRLRDLATLLDMHTGRVGSNTAREAADLLDECQRLLAKAINDDPNGRWYFRDYGLTALCAKLAGSVAISAQPVPCKVNRYWSDTCARGTRGCEGEHDQCDQCHGSGEGPSPTVGQIVLSVAVACEACGGTGKRR
jgi:hypothetical protein